MTVLCSLSHHLLIKIFGYLTVSDKKNLLKISTYLRKVASDPLLWQNVKVNKAKLAKNFADFLSISKFALLLNFDMSDLKLNFANKELVAKFLKYLSLNTNLKEVNLSNNDLSKLTPFPFSSALSHCRTLNLSQSKLETEQINSLLGKCCAGKYTKCADFSFNDFTYVNAELLVKSIKNMERINLSYADLSAVDTRRIMETVTNSDIKEIDLSGSDMSSCNFDNLGLNQNLQVLILAEVKLEQESLDTIFTNLSLVHNLRELCFKGTVLTGVEPILFSDAVTRVHTVDLNYCWLYCDHIEFLFDSITESTKLKDLNLSGNHFEEVNRDLLLEAVNHLDVLRIEWANMTEEHFETLINDTLDMKRKRIVLNHFELIDNFLHLQRIAKSNPSIEFNMGL